MQSSSLPRPSNLQSPTICTSLFSSFRLAAPIRTGLIGCFRTFSCVHQMQSYQQGLSPLHSTATQEIVETCESELQFIEVGYISSVHGLQGEINVKPNTGFPQLRFSKPGRRWLRQHVLGKEAINEVELIRGRGYHGQKSWIVKLKGINTPEKARELVGSSILVRDEDRPELEEGEIYSRDLVGMRVFFKETGELVGTVVAVCNSGAHDLLQVKLASSIVMPDRNVKPFPETSIAGHLAWVPFVEAIVPDFDMDRREMWIIPPKGLLELNIRTHEKTKKERRQIEWKERKKFQRRLISVKKKICGMEQQHIFEGFRHGTKAQKRLLAVQIVGLKCSLLLHALQNIGTPFKRWDISEFISVNSTRLVRNTLKIFEDSANHQRSQDNTPELNLKLQEKGLRLFSEGTVAIVLILNYGHSQEMCSGDALVHSHGDNPHPILQTLNDVQRFVKSEGRASVPLIVVCPADGIKSLERLFSDHDYFGFDFKKVWFFEEEKLPVVSNSLEEQGGHKILMRSPWEMIQSPIGSGGVISSLSSNDILDNLSEMGVEYVQICSVNQRHTGKSSTFLGWVDSCGADVGILISKGTIYSESDFHVIFSVEFMKKLAKRIDKLPFYAIPQKNSHVQKVDKEWAEISPSSPNSLELRCSIYSALDAADLDKVSVMEIST